MRPTILGSELDRRDVSVRQSVATLMASRTAGHVFQGLAWTGGVINSHYDGHGKAQQYQSAAELAYSIVLGMLCTTWKLHCADLANDGDKPGFEDVTQCKARKTS